ncbi:hypothetical protein [Kosakonia oryzae]|uniref:Uncharacterized protein n=1 Tax=Kosakonia oryzae TaxID=497725 RepID=A0AA94H2J9_9ENTR|nr:hypothetical protein [Kosakonia oryzae]ANI82980.1 hypothetical protein AWR26_12725 [Kosakonia oryzae]UDJ84916.1 hypothetical protein I5186_12910 [Kosakonia oryzae]SFC13759.1 hypothetical protein SAMN05216286_1718 [Kosakonia oryzae]
MKELNNNEMMAVSGAGFLSNTAGMIGGALGGVVDAILGGDKTTFADMSRKACQAVAGFIESGFGIVKNLFGGLFGSKA